MLVPAPLEYLQAMEEAKLSLIYSYPFLQSPSFMPSN